MQLNQNYPWYLQTSPVFSTLYEEMFATARNFSPVDVYKAFYPNVAVETITDGASASYALKTYANLWQVPTEFSAIEGALIYDQGQWSVTDKWNGDMTGASLDWFFRYIKMKTHINNQPFSLNLIKEAFEILMGPVGYNITVTETQNAITVNIETELQNVTVLQGILNVDKTLFGKPIGATITFNLGEQDD